MTPETATLSEICDYIAEAKGWTYEDAFWQGQPPTAPPIRMWMHPTLQQPYTFHHPVPAYLDSIAACLPDTHRWVEIAWRNLETSPGVFERICTAICEDVNGNVCCGSDVDEELARARSCALAWLRVKGDGNE